MRNDLTMKQNIYGQNYVIKINELKGNYPSNWILPYLHLICSFRMSRIINLVNLEGGSGVLAFCSGLTKFIIFL